MKLYKLKSGCVTIVVKNKDDIKVNNTKRANIFTDSIIDPICYANGQRLDENEEFGILFNCYALGGFIVFRTYSKRYPYLAAYYKDIEVVY